MRLVIEKQFKSEDFSVFLKVFKLHKNHLLLLSDHKDMGIGDVTLSTPSQIEGLKSTSSTYNLFGMRNNLLSSIIAKRAAYLLKTPVLSLVFFKKLIEDQKLIKPIVGFLNNSLKEIINNK